MGPPSPPADGHLQLRGFQPTRRHAALLLVVSGLFIWGMAFISGWPSPTCFECRGHAGTPAVLVVSSACGRSAVRHAWVAHLASQLAAAPLSYVFVVLDGSDEICADELARDAAAGLPLTVPVRRPEHLRDDVLGGLSPGDAAAMWAAAWSYVNTADPASGIATAAERGWWLRTRDDVALDALALASLLEKLHDASFTTATDTLSPLTRAVLLGDFFSSRCQHLSLRAGAPWAELSDDSGWISRGAPGHPSLSAALYVLSSAAVKLFAGTALAPGSAMLSRVSDEASAIPAVLLHSQLPQRVSAVREGSSSPPPVAILHARLEALAGQDLVWWSTRWERPVGLYMGSALHLYVPLDVHPSSRLTGASCGIALSRPAARAGGDIGLKEAVASLHDIVDVLGEA